ncbi:hypothetical protein B14_200036 (plasmid) [Bacillus licheniformis]|uniref:hypothetical protein n=1 Tax=Bacillus licheniformis TaxID=1402 RepID=UPI0009B721F9|nr:hypothetical protein [Bacillus licheniformis]ARC67247.1 hypothetical protein B14_200036 [Bacillus licheniformis]ARW46112.1 hypothetical protein S100141_04892 [Bacillus licheniformis]MDE1421904.1 hypothetical protein [Bacillus licheniformis]MEC0475909.1 hypothetical protein [Bacillus licheniformis]
MRSLIMDLKEEIVELEEALHEAKTNAVRSVLQEAIWDRNSKIDELRPNGFVLADISLNDGTLLNRCLVFSTNDGIGTDAISDIEEAESVLKDDEEVYLQQEYNDGNFSGDIETKTIKNYKLYYENDQSDEE